MKKTSPNQGPVNTSKSSKNGKTPGHLPMQRDSDFRAPTATERGTNYKKLFGG